MKGTDQLFREDSEYLCKDDVYYEEMISESLVLEINVKGGKFKYEV